MDRGSAERSAPVTTGVTVPPAFARSTIAREGPAGEAWIEALPELVRDLSAQWGLTVTGPPMHGYVALVVPVVRGRTELVLKVSWIDQSSEQEAVALRAWAGRGAVQLLDAREDVGALLLERLNPDRTLEHADVGEAVDVAGRLLRRLTVPAPAALRTVAEEIAQFRGGLAAAWEATGRPFPRRVLDLTLELTAGLPRPDAPHIVNQDLHYGNVLEGSREPWLVIDPKPLAGDPEFGVPPLLWTRFEELPDRAGFQRRFDHLMDVAGLDPPLARSWSIVRVVDYWLWAVAEGLTEDPGRCSTLLGWLVPRP